MASRFYVLPKVTETGVINGLGPKYLIGVGIHFQGMDYGLETIYVLGAEVSPAQHASISANSDVIAVPANLDAQVGGNLAAVKSALQSVHIPAAWIVSTHTYREIIGIVGNAFQFLQRLNGRWRKSVFESGITLATTFAQLTQNQRDVLRNVADSFGMDYSAITGATTIEDALFILADQLGSFPLFGEVF